MTKAEKALRSARYALSRRVWQHRCDDRVGGCTAISESARKFALKRIAQVLRGPGR